MTILRHFPAAHPVLDDRRGDPHTPTTRPTSLVDKGAEHEADPDAPDGPEPGPTPAVSGPFGFAHPESLELRQRTVRELVAELACLHDDWGVTLLSSRAADPDADLSRARARRIIAELRRRHTALHRIGEAVPSRLRLLGAVHLKPDDIPEGTLPNVDPHGQLEAARRYVVRASVAADGRSRELADRWGLASAALQDARSLLESKGAQDLARSDVPVPQGVPCAELIRSALTAIRTIPGWRDCAELTDAFRVALIALELVEGQEAP